MFKVECPGCKASYNVDERRVPASTGMKMRCPKCTTTFQVKRPEDASGATPLAPPPSPQPKPAASRPRKATVIGLGGLAPGLPGAPAPSEPGPGEEDLLPAVVRPQTTASATAPAPAPAPVHTPAPSAPTIDELDLPAVAADLPAVVPARGARARTAAPPIGDITVPDLDLDLPAPVGAMDLPAVRNQEAHLPAVRTASAQEEIDLPTVRGDTDLPAVRADADLPATRGNIDLPAVRSQVAPQPLAKSGRQITGGVLFDDIDLPSVSADLPEPRRADLPAHKEDLPARKEDVVLPAIRVDADFPSEKNSSFGEIDLPEVAPGLPTPLTSTGLLPTSPGATPSPSSEGDFHFDSIPEAPPQASPAKAAPAMSDIGGLGIPRAPSLPDFGAVKPSASPFDDPLEEDPFGLPPQSDPFGVVPPKAPTASPSKPQAPSRQAGGGINFGEVDLGGDPGGGFSTISELPKPPSQGAAASAAEAPGWGERDLGSSDDDMEFEAIPQEKGDALKNQGTPEVPSSSITAPLSGTTRVADSRSKPQVAPIPTPLRSPGRGLRTIALLGLVVLLGGGSLTFTPFGPFGVNAITDVVKAKDYEALRTSTLAALRQHFAKDLATEAARALQLAEANHASMPRAIGVTVLAAYAAYLKELRFGHDSAQHAHANTLLATIPVDPPPLAMSSPKLLRLLHPTSSPEDKIRSRPTCDAIQMTRTP
ncbi:MAG: zinc-ribbon domain-containing protein [Myxococcales bacterium]|nr:zinc-ribbon domain-containing protein [Polyangiaceae bacterium]MDW8247855.1 zinc-ribbon domain-containing protein [Myxococcales bacterium]